MSYKVVIPPLNFKSTVKPNLKEMFEWCATFCSKEYGKDGQWGSSWWTERNNTEFHFIDERDSLMFKLRWA